jgi:hypothetical protein
MHDVCVLLLFLGVQYRPERDLRIGVRTTREECGLMRLSLLRNRVEDECAKDAEVFFSCVWYFGLLLFNLIN